MQQQLPLALADRSAQGALHCAGFHRALARLQEQQRANKECKNGSVNHRAIGPKASLASIFLTTQAGGGNAVLSAEQLLQSRSCGRPTTNRRTDDGRHQGQSSGEGGAATAARRAVCVLLPTLNQCGLAFHLQASSCFTRKGIAGPASSHTRAKRHGVIRSLLWVDHHSAVPSGKCGRGRKTRRHLLLLCARKPATCAARETTLLVDYRMDTSSVRRAAPTAGSH